MKKSMKISKKQIRLLLFFGVLMLTQVSFGQADSASLEDALGFTETVDDVEASISMFVGIVALIGSYLGINKLKA